jgi:hypothetical protein
MLKNRGKIPLNAREVLKPSASVIRHFRVENRLAPKSPARSCQSPFHTKKLRKALRSRAVGGECTPQRRENGHQSRPCGPPVAILRHEDLEPPDIGPLKCSASL